VVVEMDDEDTMGVTDRLSTIYLWGIVHFFGHIARRGDDNLEWFER
jgi:hypothetical protein